MGKGNNSPKIPKVPDAGKSYTSGINAYLDSLPRLLGGETDARNQYDPQRLQHQIDLQNQFGPEMYNQMLSAFKQIDPQFVQGRNDFGNRLISNFNQKDVVGPNDYKRLMDQNEGLFHQSQDQVGKYNGLYDQSQGLFNQSQNVFGQNQALADKLKGDLAQGTHLAPDQEQELEQEIRRSQSSRGNAYGQAPVEAEAFTKGRAGQALYQQRLNNYAGSLGALGQSNQGSQSALGQSGNILNSQGSAIGQSGNILGQQGQFTGLGNAYDQQNTENLGKFLTSPNMAQIISGVPPVSVDRSQAYVNPNAGFQGQQFALQNFQNSLGSAGLQQQSGGSPWASALGSIASIAGPLIGAAAFSDKRIKTGISKVGDAKGVGLYKFAYKGAPQQKMVGAIAQDVQKTRPDAVEHDPATGLMKVNYGKLGLPSFPKPIPTSGGDTQPAMLSKGEVVLNKGEQAKVGPEKIYKAIGSRHGKALGGGVRGYGEGGVVYDDFGHRMDNDVTPSWYNSPNGQGPSGSADFTPGTDPNFEPGALPVPQDPNVNVYTQNNQPPQSSGGDMQLFNHLGYDPSHAYGSSGSGVPTQRVAGLLGGAVGNFFVPGLGFLTGPLARIAVRALQGGQPVDDVRAMVSGGSKPPQAQQPSSGNGQFNWGGLGKPSGYFEPTGGYGHGDPGNYDPTGPMGGPGTAGIVNASSPAGGGSFFGGKANWSQNLPGSTTGLGSFSSGNLGSFGNAIARQQLMHLMKFGPEAPGDWSNGMFGPNQPIAKFATQGQGGGNYGDFVSSQNSLRNLLMNNPQFFSQGGGGGESSQGPSGAGRPFTNNR